MPQFKNAKRTVQALLKCTGAAISVGLIALPAVALDVRIEGMISDELRAQAQGASLLVEKANADEDADAQEIVAVAQADYQRLLAVLYEAGYFGPSISIKLDGREAGRLSAVSPPADVATAVISVDPGRQFRFGRAEVAPLAPETELPEGFAQNEPANLSVLKSAASAAVDGWRDAGHAKARLESERIIARHSEGKLDATLQMAPGPKLRFGALTVKGNSAVRTERIHEIAALPEGETYSPEELRDATQRLQRTGAFRSVALLEAEQPTADGTLPITARIVDSEPRRFGFGAELSTNEGMLINAYWMHRNRFGGAERLRFEAEVNGIGGGTGGTGYRIGARYQRPATFNEDTGLYIETEIEQLDEVAFFSRQFSAEAGIERYASDERTYRLGLGVRRANTRDAFGDNQYALLLSPVGATFDYRDNEFDARSGYYLDAEVSPFIAVSGADNGILTSVDLRTYRTFGSESPITLAVRGQLGSLYGPGLEVSPADFLFYSGGGGTVRGHDYQSLGVTLPSGARVGGRSFLGLSAEVRFHGSGALGYVGFIDAGYVGESSFPDGSGEWHSGAGLGLRYATAVGPIRVDLAVPTSGDDDGSAFQVYIGIGQSF